MDAAAIKSPVFVITGYAGRRHVMPDEFSPDKTITIRLYRIFMRKYDDGFIVDSQGRLYTFSANRISGVDWRGYSSGGYIVGVVAVFLGLIFGNLLLRRKLNMELHENSKSTNWRDFLKQTVRENPNVYSHASEKEIIQKIDRAKSVVDLAETWFA